IRCGQSRLLELLTLLVWRPWLATVVTGPVLYRKIERDAPTLLVDEAEVVHQHGETAQDLRAILHSGNRRGATVPRCVGDDLEPRDFAVFGPKVFAAIGR